MPSRRINSDFWGTVSIKVCGIKRELEQHVEGYWGRGVRISQAQSGVMGGCQVHSQRVVWRRRKNTAFSESKREAERIGMNKINALLERTMKAYIGCLNI